MAVESQGPDNTLRIGEAIGRNLRGGEVIELISDVGGGKTTLVHGIAKGAGSQDIVASPTFTLSKKYYCKGKDITIDHYDFYRLNDPGIMTAELSESIQDGKTTVIIEWANIVEGVLPSDRVTVKIAVGENENSRQFDITFTKSSAYLFEGIE